MSSNNPFIPTTIYTVKNVIVNLKTDQQEASQTKNKKHISNDSDKSMVFNKSTSLDKSSSSSRTEIEDTVKPQTRIRLISPDSLDDKDTKEQQPKVITIRNKNL